MRNLFVGGTAEETTMTPDQMAELIRRQLDRIEELEEMLRQTRDAAKPSHAVMAALDMLTPSGARMMAAMYDAYPNAVSRERLMQVRRSRVEDVDPKIVEVVLCKAKVTMRNHGAPGPITITHFGFGYAMHPDAYAWVGARKNALAAMREAAVIGDYSQLGLGVARIGAVT